MALGWLRLDVRSGQHDKSTRIGIESLRLHLRSGQRETSRGIRIVALSLFVLFLFVSVRAARTVYGNTFR